MLKKKSEWLLIIWTLTAFSMTVAGQTEEERFALHIGSLRNSNQQLSALLAKKESPLEYQSDGFLAFTRNWVLGSQQFLARTKQVTVAPGSIDIKYAPERDILEALSRLISDVLSNPILIGVSEYAPQESSRLGEQLGMLLAFTDPDARELAKKHPISFNKLIIQFEKLSPQRSLEVMNDKALALVRKRCVDFLDDGMSYRTLRLLGASEAVLKQADTCLVGEKRAVILNRYAAMQVDEMMAQQSVELGDAFRVAFTSREIQGRKRAIAIGREFLERFGEYPGCIELTQYLKVQIPKMQQTVQKMEADAEEIRKAKIAAGIVPGSH